MADKIFFKTGSASSLPTTKTAGQLLFAIDETTGSIYLDKDSNTRIKFNADANKLTTARNIAISGTASNSIGTFDGSNNTTIYIPTTISGFESISTKKIVSPANTALYITPTSTLYLDSGSKSSIIFRQGGTAKVRFDTTGLLRPEADNVSDLGSSSYKWKNVYATTFTGALSGNATTATTLATPRNLAISDTANSLVATFNGGSNTTLYMPLNIKGFTSIESDKYVVNDKVTLQYNTTNECLEFVFA